MPRRQKHPVHFSPCASLGCNRSDRGWRLCDLFRQIALELQTIPRPGALAGGSGKPVAATLGPILICLAEFAADTLRATQRREHARVIVALSFCSATLADDDLRQGVSYERTASLLAGVLAAGVDARM